MESENIGHRTKYDSGESHGLVDCSPVHGCAGSRKSRYGLGMV